MPTESMVKDLGELFEHYGEDQRLGLHSRTIARYVIQSLVGLTDVMRALPAKPNAETRADGEPESVGAQSLLDLPSSSSEGR